MDTTLVLAASAPLTVGHLVEVVEQIDESGPDDPRPNILGSGDAGRAVVAITDCETSVRYQRVEEPDGPISRWHARVLEATITSTTGGPRTIVRVEPIRMPGVEVELALRGADAAASAAKREADRWGGGDKPPYQEPARIW